jgi:2,3-bisphosphoglycerate-independent phosphoglycerate mutase
VYEGEDRVLIPSPKVATYDLQPEMSAYAVADEATARIKSGKYDVIILNFANPDMVGHTGVREAIVKAVETIDVSVEKVVEAAKANGYEVIIIADHGNADNAENADGSPNTAHSLNPVPFVYVTENKEAKVENGKLADVAPSICQILGIDKAAEMTGHSLIK